MTNVNGVMMTNCSQTNPPIVYLIICYILYFAFFLYFFIAMCRTRQAIRARYKIEDNCGGCSDCCCTFWCSCCTINQMARHTNDYEAYPVDCCSATCFNKTGLPANAPILVV